MTTLTVDEVGPWAMAESADDLMARLFHQHYRQLLRLAAVLIDDASQCEEVVQEAFTRVYASRTRIRDHDKALAYLRQTVVNLSRSTLRRRMVAARHPQTWAPNAVSAEDEAYAAIERDSVVTAVRRLPTRCREAVMLRYYSDLSVAETAEVMGISAGAVKSYTSRGLDALAELLGTAQ